MEWVKFDFGLPFAGYQSSVPATEVPRDKAASGSFDYRFSPTEGKFVRRPGSSQLGDSGAAGLLPSKWGAIPRQVIEFKSDSLTDGYPTYGVVFTDETDKEGQFYYRSTNGNVNKTLGDEFGTTHYPVSAGGTNDASNIRLKYLPTWSENTGDNLTRFADADARKVTLAGTRRMLRSGKRLYFPSHQGTPVMWDGKFNETSDAGTEKSRLLPWGLIPPLYAAYVGTADLPTETTSVRPWANGDKFFLSVAFKFEDGSVSRPYIPQATGTNLYSATARTGEEITAFGLVTISGTAGLYRDYVRYKIPRGPDGTVGRYILRTPKVNGSSSTPDITQLRVTGYIDNNTTVIYDDYNGDDASLLAPEDTPFIHFRHVWPWRARYAFEFDGRVGIGDLKPNPAAIILAPTGRAAGRDLVDSDDGTAMGNYYFMVRVYDNAGTKTIQLRYIAGASIPGAPAQQEIAITATTTLKDVVNTINSTTTASPGKEWAATVVPGVDENTLASNLAYTTGYDFGDDTNIVNDATTGNIRAWSNAFPAVLYFTQSYMSSLATKPNSFMHTEGGPSLKLVGGFSMAHMFAVGPGYDIRPPKDAGRFLGAAPLADGLAVFYERAVYAYKNLRGGTTGEDFDYRLYPISERGCVAWDSITHGNGWVGWLSNDGYCVTDGQPNNERIITFDLHNPDTKLGDLNSEINQSLAATASNTDGARFHARVVGDKLYLSFRSATATYTNRVIEYDFGMTAGGSGLGQILRPDGHPYGWSAPYRCNWSVIGSVRKSTGLWTLAAVYESSSGYSTGDGRVDRVSSGSDDSGTAIIGLLYTRRDDFGDMRRKKRVRRMTTKYKVPSSVAALTLGFSRHPLSSSATFNDYTLPAAASRPVILINRVKLDDQAPSQVVQLEYNDSTQSSGSEIYGTTVELRYLDTKG